MRFTTALLPVSALLRLASAAGFPFADPRSLIARAESEAGLTRHGTDPEQLRASTASAVTPLDVDTGRKAER
ncbi:hypothetical protein CONLIGDRAFT_687773 [Coniochaeta ligniaria NRRL 30616]|uniref:Uncharacterized protein n=1 Tax=Coniochaeta ligniaria NRRL 30616 TaxID=1408157 RepID=A0A1J7I3J8_9PEZI|nr:hypothetical protein CONLIGDRAFT_687773 [Coniochaeta ligniaria NRRL 30616]